MYLVLLRLDASGWGSTQGGDNVGRGSAKGDLGEEGGGLWPRCKMNQNKLLQEKKNQFRKTTEKQKTKQNKRTYLSKWAGSLQAEVCSYRLASGKSLFVF